MSRIDDGTEQAGTRGTFTHAIERNAVPLGVPLAVEFTFTAPAATADSIRKLPLSVGLAVDRSGSMSGSKLESARKAAEGVLDALQDGERFAATAFDTDVLDLTPSVRLDARSRAMIRPRIAGLTAGSSTALFDGFARSAELVALGTSPSEADSWVIVLSDGMGNHGLTDPTTMRAHADALADRGIRTITIGIGEDYESTQLTALAEGGSGAFHHASFPPEIVEIVLGELNALRQITVRDLEVGITTRGTHRFSLLGGEVEDDARAGNTRFGRIGGGQQVRVVALVWPRHPRQDATLELTAQWADHLHGAAGTSLRVGTLSGPSQRNIELAVRAASLWHARIVSTALEMNEAGEYERATAYIKRWTRRFERYAMGLPGLGDLSEALRIVGERVGRTWRTMGHREAYVMARKAMLSEPDFREDSIASYCMALDMDNQPRTRR